MADHQKLNAAGRAMETPAGKAMWKMLMVVFGVLITLLLSLILAGVNRTTSIAEGARDKNYAQDQEIALLQSGMGAQKDVTTAAVAAIQSNTIQLTKLQDAIDQVRSIQQQQIVRDRPIK